MPWHPPYALLCLISLLFFSLELRALALRSSALLLSSRFALELSELHSLLLRLCAVFKVLSTHVLPEVSLFKIPQNDTEQTGFRNTGLFDALRIYLDRLSRPRFFLQNASAFCRPRAQQAPLGSCLFSLERR